MRNGAPHVLEGSLRHVWMPDQVMGLPDQLFILIAADANERGVAVGNFAFGVCHGHQQFIAREIVIILGYGRFKRTHISKLMAFMHRKDAIGKAADHPINKDTFAHKPSFPDTSPAFCTNQQEIPTNHTKSNGGEEAIAKPCADWPCAICQHQCSSNSGKVSGSVFLQFCGLRWPLRPLPAACAHSSARGCLRARPAAGCFAPVAHA